MSTAVLLKDRWLELTSDLDEKIAEKWWKKIDENFSESSRKYHNHNHIQGIFQHYDSCLENMENPKAVAFAIFFHDLVYNPKASGNAEQSAQLYNEFAEEAGLALDSPLCEQVTELILLTKTHLTSEHKVANSFGSEDKHYFLDFDMAILGSDWEAYNTYANQIREEYSFLPNAAYNGLRTKVLKSFLQIPNIFATELFRTKYEEKARKNLQQEISNLEA